METRIVNVSECSFFFFFFFVNRTSEPTPSPRSRRSKGPDCLNERTVLGDPADRLTLKMYASDTKGGRSHEVERNGRGGALMAGEG